MTPVQFAQMLRAVADEREASEQEAGSLRAACDKVCPKPWADIVHTLLYPGYADVWDWCDAVLK